MGGCVDALIWHVGAQVSVGTAIKRDPLRSRLVDITNTSILQPPSLYPPSYLPVFCTFYSFLPPCAQELRSMVDFDG